MVAVESVWVGAGHRKVPIGDLPTVQVGRRWRDADGGVGGVTADAIASVGFTADSIMVAVERVRIGSRHGEIPKGDVGAGEVRWWRRDADAWVGGVAIGAALAAGFTADPVVVAVEAVWVDSRDGEV